MSVRELLRPRAVSHDRVPPWWYEPAKRSLDVCLALVILVVFSPLWLAIALAVRLSSPGPVLFRRDDAVGRDGRTFTIFKYRTMYDRCDQTPHLQVLARFVAGEATGADSEGQTAVFKVVNDDRITPVGRWLRRSGLTRSRSSSTCCAARCRSSGRARRSRRSAQRTPRSSGAASQSDPASPVSTRPPPAGGSLWQR